MINMMRAELYRLTKSRGFWFFWIISIGSMMLSVAFHEAGGVSLGAPLQYDDDVKMDITQLAMNFTYYFLLIIPVYSIIAVEFNEHTIKNTISSAISRKMYFVSKFLFSLVYSLGSYVISCYLFYFVNKAVNGSKYSSSVGDFSKALFRQLPAFAAIVSVFILIAFLVKKGAALNAVSIITPIAYTSIALVMYGIKSTKTVAEHLLKAEISTVLSKLALGCSDSYLAKSYIAFAVMLTASALLGYLVFTKRELE